MDSKVKLDLYKKLCRKLHRNADRVVSAVNDLMDMFDSPVNLDFRVAGKTLSIIRDDGFQLNFNADFKHGGF
mgnify:CR=1 FL=1